MVACAWLIRKIPCSRWLLARQLWHLALADIFVCFAVLVNTLDLPVTSMQSVLARFGFWSFIASLLFEFHVAAGFAAVFWRWKLLLTLLSGTVWLPWLLGFLGTSFELLCHDNGLQSSSIAVALIVSTVCATLVLYLLASFRSVWSPAQAERRADSMVWSYLLTSIFTTGPVAAQLCLNLPLEVSSLSYSLNGLCNVMCYACQPKLSPTMLLQGNAIDHRQLQNRAFAQWAGVSSLPVGFLMQHHEEITVSIRSLELEPSETEVVGHDAL